MTTPRKRRLKAFIIRWEIPWYILTLLLYFASIITVAFVFPNVSNLWVSIFVMVAGFTASVGAMASAIKSQDDTE